MGVNYNTTTVSRGLLLSCDFANPKVYSKSENLIAASENFSNVFWNNSVNILSSTESDPFGGNTATLIQARNQSYGGFVRNQSISYKTFTTYTISVYAKAGSWNSIGLRPGGDLVDASDRYTYFNLSTGVATVVNGRFSSVVLSAGMTPVGNGWYRCYLTATTGSRGLGADVTDISIVGSTGSSLGTSGNTFSGNESVYVWGAMLERSNALNAYIRTTGTAATASVLTDVISGLTGSLNNTQYYSYDNNTNSLSFDRSDSTVTGGWAQFNTSGNLSANTYLYNDHTTEVFFRPIDINGTALINNTDNAIIVFQGYHAGFIYGATAGVSYLYYAIWNGIGYNTVFVPNGSILNNNWYHLVATRSVNTITIYINGQQVVSQVIGSGGGNPGTGDILKIGSGNTIGQPFAWFTKMNVSVARLYNVALTASEISQNFNAFRGRGGI